MKVPVLLLAVALLASSCDDRRQPVAPKSDPSSTPLWAVTGSVAGFVSVGERAYLSFDGGVGALDSTTGSILWEFPVRGGGRFSIPGMVVVDRTVLVRWSGILHGLSGADGAELWRNEFPEWDSDFRVVTDDEGKVYVSAENELARLDPTTGEIVWGRALAGNGGLGPAAGSGVVCSRRAPIVTLACYDGSDGSLLWEIGQIAIAPGVGMAILGGRLVVEVDGDWIGLDLETGSEVWRRGESLPSLARRATESNGVIYACRVDCLALRAADGTILWRIAVEDPSSPVASDDFVFVVARERVGQRLESRLWVLDSASGALVDEVESPENNLFIGVLTYGDGRLFVTTQLDIRAYRYP